ncbi:MAG: MAP kinase kinase (MEK), partial [Chaenotheca gracillima]
MSTLRGARASPGDALQSSKSNGSMQLLDYEPIDFSLTAGTDIPPPPPSPPPAPVSEVKPTLANTTLASDVPLPLSPSAGTGSPPRNADLLAPNSPSTSPRANGPNSPRRLSKFLSLKSLNNSYDPNPVSTPMSSTPNLLASPSSAYDHNTHLSPGESPFNNKRPSTPSVASSTMTTSKRVRSWFRRKRKISDLTPGANANGESNDIHDGTAPSGLN